MLEKQWFHESFLNVTRISYILQVMKPWCGKSGFRFRGVARILNWGTEAERSRRRRRRRDWGLGRGCLPPQPTMGSGERRELPQLDPGQSPGRQRIFGIFEAHRTLLVKRTVLL